MKKIKIKKESIMGGMSCNEMSLVPWQVLKKTTKKADGGIVELLNL